MQIRVADYIAEFLSKQNISHVFTVVGGGAMHLNDAFGHHPDLHCVYCHHEQACSIAAESYFRIHNQLPLVCVTTGPGGTNALTGVLGAWLDSIPMFIISGQVRFDTCARSTNLHLRALGDQEFDITKTVSNMTKYAKMVTDKNKIRYHLEKALYTAVSGRPGPVWLDIPLNIQSAIIETDDLTGFTPPKADSSFLSREIFEEIVSKLKSAKRPVINAGNAIRTADAKDVFDELVSALKIPVVTGWNSIDLIEDSRPLYVGRAGIMGDRAGNFAIQNSDFILSLGSRLSIRQVGYNFKSWAREAYVAAVDIDENELKKPTVHIDLPIVADVKEFMAQFLTYIKGQAIVSHSDWIQICQNWKTKYPVVLPEYQHEKNINVYHFIDTLGRILSENQITVVGNGSACVVGSQAFPIKKESRFIINSGAASMGYDLPAAIGAAFASNMQSIICITGDGSIQMNLQELQTIVHHNLPIRIFVINNGGYHSIRQTQTKFFKNKLVGIGDDSGDLSFPSLQKIAYAYNIPYFQISQTKDLESMISKALHTESFSLTEVIVSKEQNFVPKSASKLAPDGQMYSAPLEDMYPFLSPEELKENMLIPLWEE